MPYTVENELTDVGHAILGVADAVESWLSSAPQGPIAFGSEPAKAAIRALVGGWGSTILRALAMRPLSLTELSGVIPEISYPSLERRLSSMRAARQVEALSSPDSQAKPYAVTAWTRQAVGPLIAASRCECKHLPEQTESLTKIDVEAAFLLAVPLVELPPTYTGPCALTVTGSYGEEPEEQPTGVGVQIERGEVAACVSSLKTDSEASAAGSVESWVSAILEGRIDGLTLGGDSDLPRALVDGMHRSLV